MEKIIVSKVLENKPQGTELYSPMFGKCTLKKVINGVGIIQVKKDEVIYTYTRHGRYFNNGECLLFPSNKMRDWEKFQWKKGDILSDGLGTTVMFNGWSADDYIQFQTIYSVSDIPTSRKRINTGVIFNTKDFKKAFDYEKKDFIKKIEKEYDGKLNFETLETEKLYEFKDGDVIHCEIYNTTTIAIFKEFTQEEVVVYTGLIDGNIYLADKYNGCSNLCQRSNAKKIRLATEKEKELILSKLANIGKNWNPKLKQIEDLHELKPFDRVLVRSGNKKWRVSFFSHYENSPYKYGCIAGNFTQCIPYNDQTAHLLNTFNN